MIKLYLLLTASFAAIAAPGCTGDAEDARGIATGADALRALRAGEVVGSIQFGESKTISYGDYFRALTVDARAGDVLQLSVTAANGAGKPMLWINNTSSATTTNLAQNLNAAGARTATLRYAVPAAGRYYLVMRDANLLSQNFSVTLAARPGAACNPDEQECDSACNPDEQECGGVQPVLPQPANVPAWDPASCDGPSLTGAAARARFAPGDTEVNLGLMTRSVWQQKCGPSGCTNWEPFTGSVYSYYQWDGRQGWPRYLSLEGNMTATNELYLRASEPGTLPTQVSPVPLGTESSPNGAYLAAFDRQGSLRQLGRSLKVRAGCVRWSVDYVADSTTTLRMVYSL